MCFNSYFFLRGGFALCVALVIATAADAGAQDAPSISGPMVGHATESSAVIWMYAPKESQLEITLKEDSGSSKPETYSFSAVADPAGDLPGVPYTVSLKKLKPLTNYKYQVSVNGKGDAAYGGVFQTAPVTGKGSKFRMAVTSCMKFGQPQKSWELLLAEEPDLHVTLGDTQYSDTTNPTIQWKHHLRYRAVPEYSAVLKSTPNYAMWDDHDYGPNNSDGSAVGKENSLAGWNQFWGNFASGTATTPGAFFKFSWGDVDFFMVDGRYHRSPDNAPDDGDKRMLGDPQFSWLIDGLKNSKAKFKVIASGSTLSDSKDDGWRIYTFARHRLFDAIGQNKISGVVYLSGDVHRSRVWTHPESDRVGYPLIEVISSGVAYSKTLSYATVDFDTTQVDPTIQVRIIHGDGEVHANSTWKLSELTQQE